MSYCIRPRYFGRDMLVLDVPTGWAEDNICYIRKGGELTEYKVVCRSYLDKTQERIRCRRRNHTEVAVEKLCKNEQ
jgi:hypothetical protein